MLSLTLPTLLVSYASALNITGVTCTQQPLNTLRFDCIVDTNANADVWVRFGEDSGSGCQLARDTPQSLGGLRHYLTVFGLEPGVAYDWKANAIPHGGGTMVGSSCGSLTAGSLSTASGTPQLGSITITSSSSASTQAPTILTHYGCYDNPVEISDSREAFVIFDDQDNIVWYQDPSDDLAWTGVTQTVVIEAISLSRPSKTVLGVVNHEIIVEYDLTGQLLWLMCRDDGSGYCPGTTTVPDLFFSKYVHHAVERVGKQIFVLTADDVEVADPWRDCDGDPLTTTFPIVVDGVYALDPSAPSIDIDWTWNDAGVTFDYTDAGCPAGNPSDYWYGSLAGRDFMHTNSLWIDSSNEWLFSLHNQSYVTAVDADPLSLTYNTVLWEMDGTGAAGDFAFASGGYSEGFVAQHNAHWGPTGDLVMFDNKWLVPGARGVVYSVDTGTWTLDALEEFTMQDLSSSTVECSIGGSTAVMLGGNVLTTCPSESSTSNHYAVFNEFDAANNIIRTVEMECNGLDPTSTAFRAYTNPW